MLHAQAIDRRTNKPLEPESEFIIKVQDINDNAPKFTDGPYIVTVPEMSDMGKKKTGEFMWAVRLVSFSADGQEW